MSSLFTAEGFPVLHNFQLSWGAATGYFRFSRTLPAEDMISSIRLAPYTQDGWLIVNLTNGEWEIPGGTREPNEDFETTIRREMLEEAGAEIINYQPMGYFDMHSAAAEPYRPHLPHPRFYILILFGEVKRVGEIQPAKGEPIIGTEIVAPDKVFSNFRTMNRPDIGELYKLAGLLRAQD